eukprot:Gb_01746 [translate_table: standard]
MPLLHHEGNSLLPLTLFRFGSTVEGGKGLAGLIFWLDSGQLDLFPLMVTALVPMGGSLSFVPTASKTISRPYVGLCFSALHVVVSFPISSQGLCHVSVPCMAM